MNHEETKDTKKMLMKHEGLGNEIEAVTSAVVDAALKVHRALGPGLLESVYELCLAHELRKRGLRVETQVAMPIEYDGIVIESGLRLDMIVEGVLIVELKAVEMMIPIYEAQVITYLKLSDRRLALLINFNVPRLKNGIKRIVL